MTINHKGKTEIKISVAICTHNPRQDYLDRTLASLRKQSLSQSQWELLLIDNASDEHLDETFDLSWHPHGRVIRENTIGLIHARLCSFRASNTPLMVFSDDDNELAEDYLENAWRIYEDFPQLGVFGACIECEFEEPIEAPPEYIDIYRDTNGGKGTCWSNDPWHVRSNPIGAGMCVRREVANSYLSSVQDDPRRLGLGRTGQKLLACEDTDIVHHATESGFGKGIFEEMSLVHLIPSRRTSKEYLLRLAEGHAYSDTVFRAIKSCQTPEPSRLRHWLNKLRAPAFGRALLDATWKGKQKAIKDIQIDVRSGR